MNFNCKFGYIIFLLFFNIFCDRPHIVDIKSPAHIRIWVLSRYKPERISVQIKGGSLFADGKKENTVFSNFNISSAKNKLILKLYDKNMLRIEKAATNILIENADISEISFSTKTGNVVKYYRGSLEIEFLKGHIHIVNELDFEEYTALTTLSESSELLNSLSLEQTQDNDENFKKTMEIVIRSWAFANRNRHKLEHADLCDLTHCMHYNGSSNNSKKIFPVTEPLILIGEKSRPLDAYFHSTCGGSLSGPEVFWPEHHDVLNFRRGKDTDNLEKLHCRNSPHFRWSYFVDNKTISKIAELENINSIELKIKDNRISQIIFKNKDTAKSIDIYKFFTRSGRTLGWNALKSNDFGVTRDLQGYKFSGRGLGHGVGLCQWGAHTQSTEGKSFREILSFYYPGAILEKLYYE